MHGSAYKLAERPKLWGSSRLSIAFCVFLASVQTAMLRDNLGIALVCMSKPVGNTTSNMNDAVMPMPPGLTYKHNYEFDWDSMTRGRILGAFLYGYILTTMAGGYMSYNYGAKTPFMIGGIGNLIFHMMCPMAALVHTELLFACRFIQGMCSGLIAGPLFQVFGAWACEEEASTLVSIGFSGFSFGTILTYPLSGILCETNILGFGGWPLIYYVPAIMSITFVIYWYYNLYNEPESHPTIDHGEYLYLLENVDIADENLPVPWVSILTSMPFIAYILFYASFLWNIFTVMNNMPMFMQTMFGIKTKECGYLFCIPFSVTFVVRIFNGKTYPIVKNYLGLSNTVCRKLYCILGSLLITTSILTIIYVPNVTKWQVIAALTVNLAFGDFAFTAGFFPTLLDIAPNYAGLLSGISTFVSFLIACPSTLINSIILKQDTKEEWNLILWIIVAMFIFATLFYLIFGSASLQKWSISKEIQEDSITHSTSLISQSYRKSASMSLRQSSHIF